jgi:hypothetical protein
MNFEERVNIEIAEKLSLMSMNQFLELYKIGNETFELDDIETIDNETNPIVLEFQKEVLQNLSNEMKSSYEREIHKKQIEEIEKNNQLEIEREVKGFSINSFPLD